MAGAEDFIDQSELKLEMLPLHCPEENAALIREADCLSSMQLVRITLSER